MADFGLLKPFDIDDGELDGESSQQCFVLGYELAQIDAEIERPKAINKPVHAANQHRIRKSCTDAERTFSLAWMEGDSSETWMQLDVRERT